eukprot:jgi/Mesvir1/3124/Mv05564-RA.2
MHDTNSHAHAHDTNNHARAYDQHATNHPQLSGMATADVADASADEAVWTEVEDKDDGGDDGGDDNVLGPLWGQRGKPSGTFMFEEHVSTGRDWWARTGEGEDDDDDAFIVPLWAHHVGRKKTISPALGHQHGPKAPSLSNHPVGKEAALLSGHYPGKEAPLLSGHHHAAKATLDDLLRVLDPKSARAQGSSTAGEKSAQPPPPGPPPPPWLSPSGRSSLSSSSSSSSLDAWNLAPEPSASPVIVLPFAETSLPGFQGASSSGSAQSSSDRALSSSDRGLPSSERGGAAAAVLTLFHSSGLAASANLPGLGKDSAEEIVGQREGGSVAYLAAGANVAVGADSGPPAFQQERVAESPAWSAPGDLPMPTENGQRADPLEQKSNRGELPVGTTVISTSTRSSTPRTTTTTVVTLTTQGSLTPASPGQALADASAQASPGAAGGGGLGSRGGMALGVVGGGALDVLGLRTSQLGRAVDPVGLGNSQMGSQVDQEGQVGRVGQMGESGSVGVDHDGGASATPTQALKKAKKRFLGGTSWPSSSPSSSSSPTSSSSSGVPARIRAGATASSNSGVGKRAFAGGHGAASKKVGGGARKGHPLLAPPSKHGLEDPEMARLIALAATTAMARVIAKSLTLASAEKDYSVFADGEKVPNVADDDGDVGGVRWWAGAEETLRAAVAASRPHAINSMRVRGGGREEHPGPHRHEEGGPHVHEAGVLKRGGLHSREAGPIKDGRSHAHAQEGSAQGTVEVSDVGDGTAAGTATGRIAHSQNGGGNGGMWSGSHEEANTGGGREIGSPINNRSNEKGADDGTRFETDLLQRRIDARTVMLASAGTAPRGGSGEAGSGGDVAGTRGTVMWEPVGQGGEGGEGQVAPRGESSPGDSTTRVSKPVQYEPHEGASAGLDAASASAGAGAGPGPAGGAQGAPGVAAGHAGDGREGGGEPRDRLNALSAGAAVLDQAVLVKHEHGNRPNRSTTHGPIRIKNVVHRIPVDAGVLAVQPGAIKRPGFHAGTTGMAGRSQGGGSMALAAGVSGVNGTALASASIGAMAWGAVEDVADARVKGSSALGPSHKPADENRGWYSFGDRRGGAPEGTPRGHAGFPVPDAGK